MIPYFVWNGENSRNKGIVVNDLPPITRASKRIEEKQIPGRSGKLYIDDDVYDTFVYQIKCTLLPGVNIRELSNWLNGTGTLILSLEEDKYYEGIIKNQISFSSISHVLYEFPIEFELQPFAYSIKEFEHDIEQFSKIYITQSTADIYPYFKITGNGPVSITINNQTQNIRDIDEYIELDAKLEEAYKGEKNENSNVNGNYLKLSPGPNEISWTGDVESIKIKYRETYK